MDPPDTYRQRLEALRSMPEPDAAKALRSALLKGTSIEGLSFSRADVHKYFEHVHHYYGCPENTPCDHFHLDEPLPWEANLMAPVETVVELMPSLALQNCRDWSDLALIVFEFGDIIRERWLKKTAPQRKAILLQAMPGLPLKHRPDIDQCILKVCPHQRHSRSGAHYAFPHLNIEDLVKPNSLLILLDARANNAPYKFALSDRELAPLIKLRPDLLEPTKYTMGIIDEDYGMITEWESEEAAAQAIAAGDAVHPVNGFHILTLHAGMYLQLKRFLLELIPEKIQECLQSPKREGGPWESTALVPSPCTYSAGCSSLEAIVRESQYRVPTLLDIDRLEALLSACKSKAEDHIWLLREDPGYFVETVNEHKEHRPELLPGICCGRLHTTGDSETLWARTLRDTVANGYVDLFVWDKIHEHIAEVARLSQVHSKQTGEGRLLGIPSKLSPEFSESLTKAWSFLELIQLDLIQELKFGWPASLEVRAFFAQECGLGENDIVLGVRFKGSRNRKRDKELEHISQLFKYLWEPPVRQTLGTHTLVDAIEQLLRSNARARSLTSPWVVSMLSKLSVVSECLRQLSFFQPWATKIASKVKEQQTELLIDRSIMFAQWRPILSTDFTDTPLIAMGKPGSHFRYPVKKRRTQANVAMLRNAEAALDAFWAVADAQFLKSTGTTPHNLVRHIMTERSLQRTPPWVEAEKQSQADLIESSVEYIYIPFSNALHDPTQQITGTFDKLAVSTRPKPKTHGLARTDSGIDRTNVHEDRAEGQPIFHVDKRAYKVFRNLFHSPLSRDHAGDSPWQDFLHAMVATGFSAQKLQGSAWQFTPTSLDVEQPIQFHEPHPSHKLRFTWARRFGRRLARTYGEGRHVPACCMKKQDAQDCVQTAHWTSCKSVRLLEYLTR